MSYDGYSSYANYGGYGSDAGDYGGPNALNDLSGPNSSAYERIDSADGAVDTSFATENAGGNVYYYDTSYDGQGYYSDRNGSFEYGSGYFGSSFYGDRYSSFADANGAYGDQPLPLYADQQLSGPGSSAYDAASSPQFGSESAYASELSDGSTYTRETLSYGSAGHQNYFTNTDYSNVSSGSSYDVKTYAETGSSYHYYSHGTTVATYESIAFSSGGFSEYSVAAYQNGSYETTTLASGSSEQSTYIDPQGVSYQNGYYHMG